MMSVISKIKSLIPVSFKTGFLIKYFDFIYIKNLFLNKKVKDQIKNPLSIPIIIINYNQLFFLKQLVDFLVKRNFEHIVILDNKSDFPPLLEYYKEIHGRVTVELMDKNYGHTVFFQNKWLQEKYGQGYYVVTDADIVPYDRMPDDMMDKLIRILNKYHRKINKAGLALNLDDIPEHYGLKNKVLQWEAQFWQKEIEPGIYDAPVDTTFALYKPEYPGRHYHIKFLLACRLAGNYKVKHGGWYLDLDHPSEEYLHYQRSANASHSWKVDDDRNVIEKN